MLSVKSRFDVLKIPMIDEYSSSLIFGNELNELKNWLNSSSVTTEFSKHCCLNFVSCITTKLY